MGRKRLVEDETSSVSPIHKKIRTSAFVPNVADMGELSKGGVVQEQAVDAAVHVVLHEYMQKGSAYSHTFSDGRLIAVVIKTGCKPNPLYQITKQVILYGASKAGLAEKAPKNMEEVQEIYRAIHQFVGKKTRDDDQIGWVQNLIGWYVDEGYVKDFIMWFDDVMAHRVDYADAEFDKIAGPLKIVVHMPSTGLKDLFFDEQKDELKCKFEVIKDQPAPITVFELPPPIFPPRIVTCNFELVNDTVAHVVFGGNTKPFQTEFVKAGVEGKSVKVNPDDQYGEYYRVIKNMNLAKPKEVVAELTSVFDDVLHGSPVILRIKKTTHGTKNLKEVFELLVTETKHIRIDN